MEPIKQSRTEKNDSVDISEINDWFFSNSRMHFITFGFLSVIRHLSKDTLHLKLYYVMEEAKKHKDEIDRFVCSFYTDERFKLKYSKCEIWHIPLNKTISAEAIIKQTNIISLESLLKSHLSNGVNDNTVVYANDQLQSTKLNSWYTNVYEPYVESLKPKSELEASIIGNELILSWGYDKIGYQSSIAFEWRNKLIHLKVNIIAKPMGRDDIFKINANGEFSRFGWVRGSIGQGFIGIKPTIHTLENYLSITMGANSIIFRDNLKDGITSSLENENVIKVISIPMDLIDINRIRDLEQKDQIRQDITYNKRVKKETGIITKYWW